MLPKSLKQEFKELKEKRRELSNEELKQEIKEINKVEIKTKTKSK